MRTPVAVAFAALCLPLGGPAWSAQAGGTYSCSVAYAVFELRLLGDGQCTTRSLFGNNPAEACTYASGSTNDLEITSPGVPVLNRMVLRPIRAGSSGSGADMAGPGLEILQPMLDLLSDNPKESLKSRGWCSKQ